MGEGEVKGTEVEGRRGVAARGERKGAGGRGGASVWAEVGGESNKRMVSPQKLILRTNKKVNPPGPKVNS